MTVATMAVPSPTLTTTSGRPGATAPASEGHDRSQRRANQREAVRLWYTCGAKLQRVEQSVGVRCEHVDVLRRRVGDEAADNILRRCGERIVGADADSQRSGTIRAVTVRGIGSRKVGVPPRLENLQLIRLSDRQPCQGDDGPRAGIAGTECEAAVRGSQPFGARPKLQSWQVRFVTWTGDPENSSGTPLPVGVVSAANVTPLTVYAVPAAEAVSTRAPVVITSLTLPVSFCGACHAIGAARPEPAPPSNNAAAIARTMALRMAPAPEVQSRRSIIHRPSIVFTLHA